MLMANVFAQTEAFAFGKTPEQVKAEGTPDGSCLTGSSKESAVEHDLAERLTPETSASWSRSTSTLSSPRDDLEHRLVRSVGRRVRQGASMAGIVPELEKGQSPV